MQLMYNTSIDKSKQSEGDNICKENLQCSKIKVNIYVLLEKNQTIIYNLSNANDLISFLFFYLSL